MKIGQYDVNAKNGFVLFFTGFTIISVLIGAWCWHFTLWCGKFFLSLGKQFNKGIKTKEYDKDYAKRFEVYK